MKNKLLFVSGLVMAFAFIAFAAQPLYQSFLQSDMNANRYSITNAASVQASNVVAQTVNATTVSGTHYGDASHMTGLPGGGGGGSATNLINYQFYGAGVRTNAQGTPVTNVLVEVSGVSGERSMANILSPREKTANFLANLGTASNALVDAACLNSEFNNTMSPKTIFGRPGTTYGSPVIGINGLRFSRVPADQRTLFPWGNYTNFTFIVVCSGPTNEVIGTQSGAPFSYGNITNDGFSLPGTPLADGRFMRPVRYQQNMALRVGDNDATGLHGFSRAFWLHDHVSWLADGLGNKNVVLNNSQRIWSMSGDGTNLFVMLEGIGSLSTNIPNGYWTSSIPANVLSFGNTAVSTEVIGGLTNSMDGVVMSWAFFNRILSTNEIIAVNRAITWFDPSQEKVIFVGDSRTTQTAGQFGREYPFKLMSEPNFYFRRSFNEAEYSVKARDVQTNDYLETRVSMWSNSTERTIALVHIGVNDWTNGDTGLPGIPATVAGYISNICTKLKSYGMETWYITEGAVNAAGQTAFCHALNDLIIADPARYRIDRLIRRDLVFTDAVLANGTYSDGTHLTSLGNQILADFIATNAVDVKAIDVPPWLPSDGGTIYGDLSVMGNVGIGTTTPQAKLDVNGTAKAAALTLYNPALPNDASTTVVSIQGGQDATLQALNLTTALRPSAVAANRYVSMWASDNVAGRPLILQQYGGGLGVGTTTPGSTLDVAGSIRAASIGFTTNTASLALDMLVEQGDYDITGDITLTAPVNVSATEVRTTVVGLYNTTGAARTITVPGAWHSADGAGSYVIGTGVTNAIISIQTRGMRVTNVAYKAFGR